MPTETKSFTRAEVAQHNTAADCWIIINGRVYDVTKFAALHPGGKGVITQLAGRDCTEEFRLMHADTVLEKYEKRLCVGVVANEKPKYKTVFADGSKGNLYGELIPYGDPAWYQGFATPFYTASHAKYRIAVRAFVQKEIEPYCRQWDEAKSLPKSLFKVAADAHVLPAVAGAPWPVQYVGPEIIGGVKPEEYDAFHEMILIDETSRCGSAGVLWGLFGGLSIGLPPVLQWGQPAVRDRVAKECLNGDAVVCLCISEPWAGSDVANLKTTAVKTADGKHYVVNGQKKWITNGVFADYFTVACRTGGPGMGGLSFLLVERSMPGVTTKQMNCQGVWSSGTTYITFEDVLVPVENLLGKENEGFKYVMINFNHERWSICAQVMRFARVCYEEATKWAYKRETFGKKLIEHPVIRNKLGHMIRQLEATQAWLDIITYQIIKMGHHKAFSLLGGQIALLKAQCTTTFEFCAREAMQIFGGSGYVRGGQGEKVERLYREVRAYAIAGGSEEIMIDLGVRAAATWRARM